MEKKTPSHSHSEPESNDLQQKLPPSTYVPGWTPRPHLTCPADLSLQERLRQGHLLFNQGYYWEAHEVWEGAWISVGRTGVLADFIKALIKIAACGVKTLEQNERGVHRHAERACQLLTQALEDHSSVLPAGDEIQQLLDFARRLVEQGRIATEAERQQARTGGVPVLGQLPLWSPSDEST